MYVLIFAFALLLILAASWCRWRFNGAGRDGRLIAADNEAGETAELTAAPNAYAASAQGEWIDAAVVGDFPHPIVGLQHIEPDNIQGMHQWVQTEAANSDWEGIPIHERHPQDGPALGWCKNSRVIDRDGSPVLQLQPAWNSVGQKRILQDKEYKGVSPSYLGRYDSEGRYRPLQIGHVGMTNARNIRALRPAVNSEGGESEAATPPPAVPADNAAWRDAMLAQVQALIADTEDRGEAIDKLWNRLYQLETSADTVRKLIDLVQRLGSQVDDAEQNDLDQLGEQIQQALAAGNSAIDERARLRAELQAERQAHNAAIVDLAIAQGRIAPGKRAEALTCAHNDRSGAVHAWWGRERQAAPADPLVAAGNSLYATPPAIGGPAGEEVPGEQIQAVTQQLMQARNCDYPTAYNQAYSAWERGGKQALQGLVPAANTTPSHS